jgi:hypothetical protein
MPIATPRNMLTLAAGVVFDLVAREAVSRAVPASRGRHVTWLSCCEETNEIGGGTL